ncbi:MAG: hypothetical protein LBG52_07305 [Candidatus Peribacteria bacterium]|nr:hypothetical protein [Candidatus Peribacteria bacterium]
MTTNQKVNIKVRDALGNVASTTVIISNIGVEVSRSPSGGSASLKKDHCPEGDFSSSYYDGAC